MEIPAGTFLDNENPSRRCPCVLLLDTSASMAETPIRELNSALPEFCKAILEDDTARLAVELAVVTFGGSPQVVQDWTDIDHFQPPTLRATGGTPLGPALQMAMDMTVARRKYLKENKVPYYVPWIFILTDGAPDEGEELNAAVARVQQMQKTAPHEKSPQLVVYACSTDKSDKAISKLQSVTQRTYAIEGMAYKEMFLWLSASFKSKSRATPDVATVLPETPSQMTFVQARTIP